MVWNSAVAAKILDLKENVFFIQPDIQKKYRYEIRKADERLHLALSKTKAGSNGPVTVYINLLSLDGERFQNDAINGEIVKEPYPKGVAGGISDSVERLKSLNPLTNEVLRLHVANPFAFEKLIDWYLGKSSLLSAPEKSASKLGVEVPGKLLPRDPMEFLSAKVPYASIPLDPLNRKRTPLTPEEDEQRRKKQADNGLRGEVLAKKYEISRLKDLGCPKPDDYVDHIALKDTGAGYDLVSVWDSETRYIEVKAGESKINSFFISSNEVETLKQLGDRGWIYLVDLSKEGDLMNCVTEISNAGEKLTRKDALKPTQYRATLQS